jgi:hypothetical protein
MLNESFLLFANEDRSELGLRFAVEIQYALELASFSIDLRESRPMQLLLGGVSGLLGVDCHGG